MNRAVCVAMMFGVAALFGAMGVVTRKLTDFGLESQEIAFVALSITTMVLFVVFLFFDRKAFRIQLKDLWLFVIFGLFKFGLDTTLFMAQTQISLALASLLEMMAPYFVIFLSLVFFKESVTVKKILAILVAIAGCILATGVLFNSQELQMLGIVVGVLSGVFDALYSICSQAVMDRNYSAGTALFYAFLFATLFSAPFSNPGHVANVVTQPEPLIYAVILAVVLTLIPYYVINLCTKHLGATLTSMIGLSEVVFSAVFGYFLFDENVDILNAFGMVLVLASIVLVAYHFHRTERAKELDMLLCTVVIDGEAPAAIARKAREDIRERHERVVAEAERIHGVIQDNIQEKKDDIREFHENVADNIQVKKEEIRERRH